MSASPAPRPLARRAATLAPSATLAMTARVAELRRQGVEVIGLTAGEPDFPPPECAREAGIRAIRDGRGRYTAAAGIPELREAVAAQAARDFGLPWEPEQVVVCNGAKIALAQTLLATVERGDNVLLPTPCWTSFPEMVKLAEGEPRLVPCGADLQPRVADLEEARDERTAALVLNTPGNPSGVVLSEERAHAIGAWALERGVRIVSDEIYASLTYGDARHVSPLAAVPELRRTSAWIHGVSKAYAMTGWRMGFLAGAPEIVRAVATMQSQLASSPNTISQYASLAALQSGDADRESMRVAFERRAGVVSERLTSVPGFRFMAPRGAFYVFVDVSELVGRRDPATGRVVEDGDTFVEILLEADRVATVPGSAFLAPACFRISFAAADEVLAEALDRIAARVAALE